MKVCRVFFVSALCFLALIGLTGCRNVYKWNQRLAVTVTTPSGEKTGSAVIRVSATVGRQFATGQDTILTQGFAGEATSVDLGDGKYLFAILSTSGANATTELANQTLTPIVKIDLALDEIARLNAKYKAFENMRGARLVPRNAYPTLVTFSDINNPESVKEVKPEGLAKIFGQGYELKSISLEVTEEAVTKGEIDTILTWLPRYFSKHLDGNEIESISASNRLANSLTSGNFDTEQ